MGSMFKKGVVFTESRQLLTSALEKLHQREMKVNFNDHELPDFVQDFLERQVAKDNYDEASVLMNFVCRRAPTAVDFEELVGPNSWGKFLNLRHSPPLRELLETKNYVWCVLETSEYDQFNTSGVMTNEWRAS